MADFDHAAALRGLHLLRHARRRWLHEYADLEGRRFRDYVHRTEIAVLLQGDAVETLMWARSLDDWCTGKDTQTPLPSYVAARPLVAELLGAARYAANKAIHQLTEVVISYGVMNFPLNLGTGAGIFNTFGGVRWATEEYLPPMPTNLRTEEATNRELYLRHLAGKDMADTLLAVEEWFERQLQNKAPGDS